MYQVCDSSPCQGCCRGSKFPHFDTVPRAHQVPFVDNVPSKLQTAPYLVVITKYYQTTVSYKFIELHINKFKLILLPN